MHEYEKKDIEECLQHRRLVFIGDSTTRQVFWAVAKKLDQKRADQEITNLLEFEEKHTDLEFVASGVTVQFIWDPWLNSMKLENELNMFTPDPSSDPHVGRNETAGLILLGAPWLWYARYGQDNFLRDFRDSIDAVIPYMVHAPRDNAAAPISRPLTSRKLSPNFLLLAPVQVPCYESLSPSREETMTPEKIDQMNDYLQQASMHAKADVVWSYSLMTWGSKSAYEESGLHVVNDVANRKADVLLNLRCNADAMSGGYPFDRTCCSNYKQPSVAQWFVIVIGMLILLALLLGRRKHVARISRYLPATQNLTALTIFALVVCFCFYTDRTQLFGKAHKQFRKREFLTACLAVAVTGLASIRRSKGPAKPTADLYDQSILSRHQTDEWKGWMQFVILIYHHFHGSKALEIYEIVRLLVTSYLFMTGFGHTIYFLNRDDYSLKRVASVLIRLNMLTCTLTYMMRTDYLFYYFPPLASFWFLVVYFVLKIGRHQNSNTYFLIGKLFLSAILTTAFTMIPEVMEFVALILRYTCATSWNMKELRFRLFLDMYIVYFGMLFAVLYHRAFSLKSGSAPSRTVIDSILDLTIAYNRMFKMILLIISLILLAGFWFSPDDRLTRKTITGGTLIFPSSQSSASYCSAILTEFSETTTRQPSHGLVAFHSRHTFCNTIPGWQVIGKVC